MTGEEEGPRDCVGCGEAYYFVPLPGEQFTYHGRFYCAGCTPLTDRYSEPTVQINDDDDEGS